MNDLSFMTILTLISVDIPGFAQIIQRVLISFIYLDALQTDKWLMPLMFKKKTTAGSGRILASEDNEDQGINSFFE